MIAVVEVEDLMEAVEEEEETCIGVGEEVEEEILVVAVLEFLVAVMVVEVYQEVEDLEMNTTKKVVKNSCR